MTTQNKLDILHHLQLAINHKESLWALGMQLFIDYSHKKKDEDYVRLVESLQSQAKDNPEAMRTILGESYNFFVHFSKHTVKQPGEVSTPAGSLKILTNRFAALFFKPNSIDVSGRKRVAIF